MSGSPSSHPARSPSHPPTRDAAQMAVIRRQFLDHGMVPDDAVPAPILRSWQRCRALGLSMTARPQIEPIDRPAFVERRARAERLCAIASPTLDRLRGAAATTGGIVLLTDEDGTVLDAHGDAAFAERAARVALRPGVDWREASTGTNAIGAALAERREITVHGGQHFFESHRILSCTAAPIRGPDGTIVGVLDLSDHAAGRTDRAATLVRRALSEIEARLFAPVAERHDVVRLHARPDGLDGGEEGLLAFADDRLIGANRSALALLDLDWSDIGRLDLAEIFLGGRRDRDGRTARMVTPAGRTLFGRWQSPVRSIPAPDATACALPAIAPAQVPVPTLGPDEPPVMVWDEARSRALARAVRLIDADVPVLVNGETGTGKEVFARALHAASRRKDRPFVAVNCAALPEGLIEAELFGYEEGAFTGARRRGSKGLLREADGGVLFLDEIGDMPPSLQARLLRVLQEREVTPLGGGRPVKVDFALVSATHHDLVAAVETRQFRQDLYFRIAPYTVALDPLRTRSDLRDVVARLWEAQAGRIGGARLSPEAFERLAAHAWPGNFRQLAATLRTLAILAEPGEVLGAEALPADIRTATTMRRDMTEAPAAARPLDGSAELAEATAAAIRAALAASGGNVSRAARRLGIHRSTLHRRLRESEPRRH